MGMGLTSSHIPHNYYVYIYIFAMELNRDETKTEWNETKP